MQEQTARDPVRLPFSDQGSPLRPAPVVRVAQGAVLLTAVGAVWAASQAPRPGSASDWVVLLLMAALGPALVGFVLGTRLTAYPDRVFVRAIGQRSDVVFDEVVGIDGRGRPVFADGRPWGWDLIHRRERTDLVAALRGAGVPDAR